MTSDQGYVTGNFLTSDISSNKISALNMKVGQTDRQMNWQTDKWHTGGFQQTTKLCVLEVTSIILH